MLLIAALIFSKAFAGWIFLGGSQASNNRGNYGTIGVSDLTVFPGASYGSASAGNSTMMFLYGGYLVDSGTDVLMAYSFLTGGWVWLSGTGTDTGPMAHIRGIPDAASNPGARIFAAAEYDFVSESLYVFGGIIQFVQDRYTENSVFRFDFRSNLWEYTAGTTGVAQLGEYGPQGEEGPHYTPPSLAGTAHCLDADDRYMYIFGGFTDLNVSYNLVSFCDTWRFNLETRQWSWVNGPGFSLCFGDSVSQFPIARHSPGMTYSHERKTMYIFGGSSLFDMNDIWAYHVRENVWQKLSDQRSIYGLGYYGKQFTQAFGNVPRGRALAQLEIDEADGIIYLFGGTFDRYSSSTIGEFNDFWQFNIAARQWTWLGGSNGAQGLGSFGPVGVDRPSNMPSCRASAVSYYRQESKELFLFGGARNLYFSILNDLWKFVRDRTYDVIVGNDTDSFVPRTIRPMTRRSVVSSAEDSALSPIAQAVIGIVIGVVTTIVLLIVIRIVFIGRATSEVQKSKTDRLHNGTNFAHDKTGLSIRHSKTMAVEKTTISTSEVSSSLVITTASSIESSKEIDEFRLDATSISLSEQVARQNGVPLHLAKPNNDKLKSYGHKITVKFYGGDVDNLPRDVQKVFWEEVTLLSKLRVSSVCKIIGFCSNPTMIMFPYYKLGTLEQVLLQKSVPKNIRLVFFFTLDIALAVQKLHALGYAHRNIKPRNIFVGFQRSEGKSRFKAVLSGFGGACRADDDDHCKNIFPVYNIDVTSANFIAPEVYLAIKFQLPDEPAKAMKAGDIYSLGALIQKLSREFV